MSLNDYKIIRTLFAFIIEMFSIDGYDRPLIAVYYGGT